MTPTTQPSRIGELQPGKGFLVLTGVTALVLVLGVVALIRLFRKRG